MDNIRQVIEQKRCVGCGACRNICPTGAISLELNKEGFYQPNLSTEKCIQCSLCDKVCPVGNVQYINSFIFSCYTFLLFFAIVNLIILKIDGIVATVSKAIIIKSKSKFDVPYFISYLKS